MSNAAKAIRHRIRAGHLKGHTAGLAPGFLQVNLVVLPQDYAEDFEAFCRANSQACPLISSTRPGQRDWPALGAEISILHDLPAYNVYERGVLTESCSNLEHVWRDDFVSFAIGCSFTFEHALCRAGISLRHIEADTTVAMFKTNIQTMPTGPFSGPMVVSMRPLPADRVDEASRISAGYPWAHGAPVHVGNPQAIGIADISSPDWGVCLEVMDTEIPVFWACGVTPQAALASAGLPLCITHCPGHMLVTDLPEDGPFGGHNP